MKMITCPMCGKKLTAESADAVSETRDAQGGATLETRCLELTEIRVEGGTDGKPLKFIGKAAPYESLSKPLKLKTSAGKEVRFREKIARGAFDDVLKGKGGGGGGSEALMLVGHDPHKALARRSVGTLKLEERDDGLYFEATPANTTLARDTAEDVRAGNIKGMSIGFGDPEDRWEKIDGENIRTLTKVPLKEVSATTIPAYEDTAIESRSAELAIAELDGGAKEVRGNVPGASLISMHARSAMYACREAHDAMERAIETLGSTGGADGKLSEHEKRHVRDLKKHVQHVTGKAAELREAISSINDLDAGTAEGDGPNQGDANGSATAAKNPPKGGRGAIAGDGADTPLDAGADPLRSLAWRQRVQEAAESDLMTKELRTVPFTTETRSGESVHASTAARARKAIADGATDDGEWNAPNQGDRKQEDCLGSELSYPIFKGEKLSLGALRNAASRGAKNAPAVGKEASALLELHGKKTAA